MPSEEEFKETIKKFITTARQMTKKINEDRASRGEPPIVRDRSLYPTNPTPSEAFHGFLADEIFKDDSSTSPVPQSTPQLPAYEPPPQPAYQPPPLPPPQPMYTPIYTQSEETEDAIDDFISEDSTILGTEPNGASVEVDDVVRQSGMYLLGIQGRGKSSLLEQLIYQDICKNYGVIVLDPHGDLIDHCLAQMPADRLHDTYVLNIEDVDFPFGLNIFSIPENATVIEQQQALDRALQVFEKCFPDTSRMLLEKYIGNIAPVFFAHPNAGYAMTDIRKFLLNDSFRSHLLQSKRLTYFVKSFWEDEYAELSKSVQNTETRSLSTRLNRFMRSPIASNIIGQSSTTIDFRKAIEHNEIIFIRLPLKTLREDATLIGTMLISQIHAAIFSFADMPLADRPGFSLFIDEFQNFVTPDIEEIFTQGRKFGCRLTVAHQIREQLPRYLAKTTVGAQTIISFQTTHDDAYEMARVFSGYEYNYPDDDYEEEEQPQRRPTIIYTNPLEQKDFREHPSEDVREFYRDYVSKLQEAAKLRLSKDATAVTYDFGYGKQVTFSPIDAQRVVDRLNVLLYNAQKNEAEDEQDMMEVAELYVKLTQLISTKQFLVQSVHQKMSELAQQSKQILDKREAEVQQALKRREEYQAKLRLMGKSYEEAFEIAAVQYSREKTTIWEQWEPKWQAADKEYMQLLGHEWEEKTVYEPAIERFRSALASTVHRLIAYPIAADTGEIERERERQERERERAREKREREREKAVGKLSVEDDLKNLKKRYAFVKVGSDVFYMQTNPIPAFCSAQEEQQRHARIQAQTRATYCRPSQEVEQEIMIRLDQSTTQEQDAPPPDDATIATGSQDTTQSTKWTPFEDEDGTSQRAQAGEEATLGRHREEPAQQGEREPEPQPEPIRASRDKVNVLSAQLNAKEIDRDTTILASLGEHYVLTINQWMRLFSWGSYPRATIYFKELREQGYIFRKDREGRGGTLVSGDWFFLSTKGANELIKRKQAEPQFKLEPNEVEKASGDTLLHTYLVNEILINLRLLERTQPQIVTIEQLDHERSMRRTYQSVLGTDAKFYPDGYLRLLVPTHNGLKRHYMFLELQYTTQKDKQSWQTTVKKYLDLFSKTATLEKFFQSKTPQVLVITVDAEYAALYQHWTEEAVTAAGEKGKAYSNRFVIGTYDMQFTQFLGKG